MRVYVFSVARICNLFVSPEITAGRADFSDDVGARRLRRFNVQNLQGALPFHKPWNFVRRSGRKRRAPLIAASPRRAMPQNSILRQVDRCQHARPFGRSADYKSAIRQITNLRYDAALYAKHIPSRLEI